MYGYMPSEAARLVVGYLRETKCTLSEKQFLDESIHLKEYSQCLKSGYRYPTSIEGYSLLEILKNFYIFTHLSSCSEDDVHDFLDNFMNILPKLQRLLKSREIKKRQNASKVKGVVKSYRQKNNIGKRLEKLSPQILQPENDQCERNEKHSSSQIGVPSPTGSLLDEEDCSEGNDEGLKQKCDSQTPDKSEITLAATQTQTSRVSEFSQSIHLVQTEQIYNSDGAMNNELSLCKNTNLYTRMQNEFRNNFPANITSNVRSNSSSVSSPNTRTSHTTTISSPSRTNSTSRKTNLQATNSPRRIELQAAPNVTSPHFSRTNLPTSSGTCNLPNSNSNAPSRIILLTPNTPNRRNLAPSKNIEKSPLSQAVNMCSRKVQSSMNHSPSRTIESSPSHTPSMPIESLSSHTPSRTIESSLNQTPSSTIHCSITRTPSVKTQSTMSHTGRTIQSSVSHTPGWTIQNTMSHTPRKTIESTMNQTPSRTVRSTMNQTPSRTSKSAINQTPSRVIESTITHAPARTIESSMNQTPSRTNQSTSGSAVQSAVNNTPSSIDTPNRAIPSCDSNPSLWSGKTPNRTSLNSSNNTPSRKSPSLSRHTLNDRNIVPSIRGSKWNVPSPITISNSAGYSLPSPATNTSCDGSNVPSPTVNSSTNQPPPGSNTPATPNRTNLLPSNLVRNEKNIFSSRQTPTRTFQPSNNTPNRTNLTATSQVLSQNILSNNTSSPIASPQSVVYYFSNSTPNPSVSSNQVGSPQTVTYVYSVESNGGNQTPRESSVLPIVSEETTAAESSTQNDLTPPSGETNVNENPQSVPNIYSIESNGGNNTPRESLVIPTVIEKTAAVEPSMRNDLNPSSREAVVVESPQSIQYIYSIESNGGNQTPRENLVVPTVSEETAAVESSTQNDLNPPSREAIVDESPQSIQYIYSIESNGGNRTPQDSLVIQNATEETAVTESSTANTFNPSSQETHVVENPQSVGYVYERETTTVESDKEPSTPNNLNHPRESNTLDKIDDIILLSIPLENECDIASTTCIPSPSFPNLKDIQRFPLTPLKSPFFLRQHSPLDFSKQSPSQLFRVFNQKDDITPVNSVKPDLPKRYPDPSSPRYLLSQQRSQNTSLTTPIKEFPPPDYNFFSPRRKNLIPRRRLLGASPSSSRKNSEPEVSPSVSSQSSQPEENPNYSIVLEELINYTPLIEKLTENINQVVFTDKNETPIKERDKNSEEEKKTLESNLPDSLIKNIIDKTESDPVFSEMLNMFFDRPDSSRDSFDVASCMDDLANSVTLHKGVEEDNSDVNVDIPQELDNDNGSERGENLDKRTNNETEISNHTIDISATISADIKSSNGSALILESNSDALNPGVYIIAHNLGTNTSTSSSIIVQSSNQNPKTFGPAIPFDSTQFGTCVQVLDRPIMSTTSNSVSRMNTLVLNATAVTPVKIAIPDYHFLNLSNNPMVGVPQVVLNQTYNASNCVPVFRNSFSSNITAPTVSLNAQPTKERPIIPPKRRKIPSVAANDVNKKKVTAKLQTNDQLHVRTLQFDSVGAGSLKPKKSYARSLKFDSNTDNSRNTGIDSPRDNTRSPKPNDPLTSPSKANMPKTKDIPNKLNKVLTKNSACTKKHFNEMKKDLAVKLKPKDLKSSNSSKNNDNDTRNKTTEKLGNNDDKEVADALVSLASIAPKPSKGKDEQNSEKTEHRNGKRKNFSNNDRKKKIQKQLEKMDVDKFLEKIHPSNV